MNAEIVSYKNEDFYGINSRNPDMADYLFNLYPKAWLLCVNMNYMVSYNYARDVYKSFDNYESSDDQVITKLEFPPKQQNLGKLKAACITNEFDLIRNKIICNHSCSFNMYNDFRNPQIAVSKDNQSKYYSADVDSYKDFFNNNKVSEPQFIKYLSSHCESSSDRPNCNSYFKSLYNKDKFHIKYDHNANKCMDFRNSMPNPEVDITIIYNKTFKTKVSLLYRIDSKMNEIDAKYRYYGGDGTIPSGSSLIPALIWKSLNDINKNGINITFADFCSISDFHYNTDLSEEFNNRTEDIENVIKQEFFQIKCMELNEDKAKFDKLKHTGMIGNSHIIEYLNYKLIYGMNDKSRYEQSIIKELAAIDTQSEIHNIFESVYFPINNKRRKKKRRIFK